jgi:hypothetical protein
MGKVKEAISDTETVVSEILGMMDIIADVHTTLDHMDLPSNEKKANEKVIGKAEKAIENKITILREGDVIGPELLAYAVEFNLENVVKMLLEAGANPLHADPVTGKSCVELAKAELVEQQTLKTEGLENDPIIARAEAIVKLVEAKIGLIGHEGVKIGIMKQHAPGRGRTQEAADKAHENVLKLMKEIADTLALLDYSVLNANQKGHHNAAIRRMESRINVQVGNIMRCELQTEGDLLGSLLMAAIQYGLEGAVRELGGADKKYVDPRTGKSCFELAEDMLHEAEVGRQEGLYNDRHVKDAKVIVSRVRPMRSIAEIEQEQAKIRQVEKHAPGGGKADVPKPPQNRAAPRLLR